MLYNSRAYKLVYIIALQDVGGGAALCDSCRRRFLDFTTFHADPEALRQAKRGLIVFGDEMYVVHGPGGRQQVCLPCFTTVDHLVFSPRG